MKNLRVIYFCDIDDGMEQERLDIQKFLARVHGLKTKVELWDVPPFEERFDVLFFDWGGMSMGNSMLEHFCGYVIENAENNPGRIYIMSSSMTEYAMKEALAELEDKPNNIYLTKEKAKMALSCLNV